VTSVTRTFLDQAVSWFQRVFCLALNVTFPPNPTEMTDEERDRRSAQEWQRSVLAYVDFKMGESWRRLHRPGERFHDVRQHWLDVWRTCNAAFQSTALPGAVVPPLEGSVGQSELSKKPPRSERLAAALKRAKGAGK
jgi:hypothetical protein